MINKSDDLKPKKSGLSEREKGMLIFLIALVFFAASYFFIWKPQTEKLNALEIQSQEFQAKIDENNAVLAQEKSIDSGYVEARKKEKKVAAKYFKELDQPNIIYKVNDILYSDQVFFPSYAFYNPQTEDINDFQVQSMGMSLPFDGSYNAIMDTLKKIKANNQKIIVENIAIQRDDAQRFLSGDMKLKFYSLDGILPKSEILEEDNPDDIVAKPIPDEQDEENAAFLVAENEGKGNDGKSNETGKNVNSSPNNVNAEEVVGVDTGWENSPFKPFYNPKTEEEKEEEEKEPLDPLITTKLLSFTGGTYYYLPSHDLIKGNVRLVNKGREGKALRVEYDMVAIEKSKAFQKGKFDASEENGNYALIDFSNYPVKISYPPDNVSLWIFSYDYSPVTVGIIVEDQLGGEKFVPITEGIGWTGWNQVSTQLPEQMSFYPLTVKKFYISMPEGSDGSGVLLLDEFEQNYSRNIDEEGEDASIEPYQTYVVRDGDTLESISKKFYGTTKYSGEIKTLNEIKGNSALRAGQVLILRRR